MQQPLVSGFSTAMGGPAIDRASAASIDESSSPISRYAALYYANANINAYFDTNTANHINLNDDPDAMELFGLPMIENTSNQCSSPVLLNMDLASSYSCHDHNKPMWWLVLRWMKIMLLKIARSYNAKPFLLVIAPLLVGITIGYVIGIWHKSSQLQLQLQLQSTETKRQHQRQRIRRTWVGKVTEWMYIFWFRLCLVASCCFLRDDTSTTKCSIEGESSPLLSSTVTGEHSTKKMPMGCPVLASSSGTNVASISNCGNKENNNKNGNRPAVASAATNTNVTVTVTRSENTGLESRESKARKLLKSDDGTSRESGVPLDQVPKHVAVIMDGNRRYGKKKYGSAARGHWDGSSKVVEFAKWCIAEHIAVLTVFAFSSENWKRDPAEIASLMQIFAKYCDELRVEAIQRNIKIMVLSTDYEKVPSHVRVNVKRMVNETQYCNGMIMNICLSYGSRGEIVGATKLIVEDVLRETLDPETIDENTIEERLLTHNCGGDPDVMIRTSGELRISNFLLWQLAYTEFFFVEKPWPAMEKNDLLEVIRNYAKGRSRRYGR